MEETMKEKYFERLFLRYPSLTGIRSEIAEAYELLETCYENGGKLLVCGNGGSAADSDHIVGELMKGFYKTRPLEKETLKRVGSLGEKLQGALPAIALTGHSALSSAFANDVDPEMVFAQQVYGYGKEGDALICLSTSGNSVNVCNAARVGKAAGMKVIAMTGRDGGRLRDLSDVSLIAPAEETADIQELHLPIYHALCAMLEEHFFPERTA